MVNIDQDEKGQETQDKHRCTGIETEPQHGQSSRCASTRSVEKSQGPKASGPNLCNGGVILLLDASFQCLNFGQLQVVSSTYLCFLVVLFRLHFIQYVVDDVSYVFLNPISGINIDH